MKKYKMVEVEYYDISQFGDYGFDPNTLVSNQCIRLKTIGWLIAQDEICIAICTEKGSDPSESNPFRDVTVIPRACINGKIKTIRTPKKNLKV
jgi:hypothetical protein